MLCHSLSITTRPSMDLARTSVNVVEVACVILAKEIPQRLCDEWRRLLVKRLWRTPSNHRLFDACTNFNQIT